MAARQISIGASGHRRISRRAPLSLAGLVLATSLGWLGCSRPPRDVIFVSLDCVRADDFRNAVAASPELEARFRSWRVLANAYTPMPFTLPAHMTALTGLSPRIHGVDRRDRSLSPKARTLAELLSASGYRTAAIVNGTWLAPGFGFGRGFESYVAVPSTLRAAPQVLAAAESWLDGVRADESIFLFVHYFDAHSDFAAEGNSAPYFVPAAAETSKPEIPVEPFCDSGGRCATDFLLDVVRERRRLEAQRLEALRTQYRGGVRALVEDLGSLLDALERRGRLRSSLVVLFSDHGEEFQEHGTLLHSQVYEETLRVPLLLHAPGTAGGEVDGCAALSDLYTTAATWAGVEDDVPEAQEGGADLLARDLSNLDCERRTLTFQDKLFRRRFAIRRGDWKLHLDQREGAMRLFDLRSDPAEAIDLASRQVAVASELRDALRARIASDRAAAVRFELLPLTGEVLSEEELRQLRSLGYLH